MKIVIDENFRKSPIKVKFPKDFEDWVNKELNSVIIYDRWKRLARCPICDKTWSYDDVDEKIRKGDIVVCPYCGVEKVAMPHTAAPLGSDNSFFWMWNQGKSIRFALAWVEWKYNGESLCEPEEPIYFSTAYPYIVGKISHTQQDCFEYYYGNFHKSSDVRLPSMSGLGPLIVHETVQDVLDRSWAKYKSITATDPARAVRELALHAKYPGLEYVAKAGLKELIQRKCFGVYIGFRPSWNADSIPGLLHLSPQDVDKLKQWEMWDVDHIATYKYLLKTRRKIRKADLEIFSEQFYDAREVKHMEHLTGVVIMDPIRMARYLSKQQEKTGVPKWQLKQLYQDLLLQSAGLGYDLNDEYYRYPPDLKKAHDRVSVEYREEKKKAERMARREKDAKYKEKILPELTAFSYQDDKYLIWPLESYADFSREGRHNKNCVLSYYDRAVAGESYIFVLRKVEDPETSYITVELSRDKKRLVQCYGTGNSLPDKEAREWANDWLEKIVKKKEKVRLNIAS